MAGRPAAARRRASGLDAASGPHPVRCLHAPPSLRLPGLLLAAAITAACVPNVLYRPQGVVEEADHTLAFVEFDDHGELWQPSQLERAIERIQEAHRQSPEGALVTVYVHGWNHNASPRNEARSQGNVYGFHRLLSTIAKSERRFNPHRPRPVVGVYIGWRGKLGRGFLNALTFYNRRQAAERIAGIAATEVVYRLMAASKATAGSRCVLIGHSFGGMVLEKTLSQALVGNLFASGNADRRQIEMPADLVILINPASPAINAKQFIEVMERNRLHLYRRTEDSPRVERPLIVSLTSEADWATRLLFPAGLQPKAIFANFRESYGPEYCGATASQKSFFSQTAGHHDLLQSHYVTAESAQEARSGSAPVWLADGVRWEYDAETQQAVVVFDSGKKRYKLKRKPRAFNDTPYWIMKVPESLIPNHAEVFRQETFRLLQALLSSSGALERNTTTELVRELGPRPIGMVPMEDRGILFLDRSRRLYRVDAAGQKAFFASCMPAAMDPWNGLGFAYADDAVYTAVRRPNGRSGTFAVLFNHARFTPQGVTLLEQVEVPEEEPFTHMTADVRGRRGFLLEQGSNRIWQVDLGSRRARAEVLVEIPEAAPLTQIFYQNDGRGLFAVDGSGTLFGVDLRGFSPVPSKLASGLGWITGLAYDPARQILYIAEAQQSRVWRLSCEPGGRCAAPRLFVADPLFQSPAALQVTADGRLWVGDRSSQVIARISPDGQIEQTIDTLRPLR